MGVDDKVRIVGVVTRMCQAIFVVDVGGADFELLSAHRGRLSNVLFEDVGLHEPNSDWDGAGWLNVYKLITSSDGVARMVSAKISLRSDTF